MSRRTKSLILGGNEQDEWKAVLAQHQFIQSGQPWIYEKHIGPVTILTYWTEPWQGSVSGPCAISLLNQGEEFCQRRFSIEDFDDALQNAIEAVQQVVQRDTLYKTDKAFPIGEPEEGDIEVLWDEYQA